MEFGGEEDRVHLLIDAHPAMDLATAIANQKPSSTTKYDWLQTILNNDIMSGSITIIKPQLGATNGNLSNLELSLAVGVIVGSD